MPDLDDLHRLAPTVDTPAAADLFRRGRRRARTRRHGMFAAAAALLVVAGAIALLARDDAGDGTAVVAEPPAADPPADFEVLAVSQSDEPLGTLRAATDPDAMEQLWAVSGADGDVPSIDLTEDVVVSITIPDDLCPPELRRFDRQGDTLTPVFVEPEELCPLPLVARTFVVALDRDSLEPGFSLLLPGQEQFGFGEQTLRVDLSAATTPDPLPATDTTSPDPPESQVPSCAAIEAFADSLVESGLVYDYAATESPEELFERSDHVVIGSLRGVTHQRETGDDALGQERWIGYEIWITSLSKEEQPDVIDGIATVWTPYVNDRDDAAEIASQAAGAPVAVFANVDPALGAVARVEGIFTGCPGGPLIGQNVSQLGEWQSIATLDDLIARIHAAAG